MNSDPFIFTLYTSLSDNKMMKLIARTFSILENVAKYNCVELSGTEAINFIRLYLDEFPQWIDGSFLPILDVSNRSSHYHFVSLWNHHIRGNPSGSFQFRTFVNYHGLPGSGGTIGIQF